MTASCAKDSGCVGGADQALTLASTWHHGHGEDPGRCMVTCSREMLIREGLHTIPLCLDGTITRVETMKVGLNRAIPSTLAN